MHSIYISSSSRRGSVMVLVVAVLGLLAVIGTVYIVSARTDRSTAIASQTVVNFNLARSAVMSQVQQSIANTTVDSGGQVGGFNTSGGTYGNLAARNFDYPEFNNAGTGATSYNPNLKDEPWLVRGLHVVQPPTAPYDFTALSPNLFDPSVGKYSISLASVTTNMMFNVVDDQTTGDATEDPANTGFDSYIYLLPFSDASGIRYRYGIRIIDTSRMANLNTGSPDDAKSLTDVTGTYLTSMRLAPSSSYTGTNYYNTNDSASLANFHYNATNPQGTGRVTNGSSYQTFDPQSWQSAILHIEKPTDPYSALFDLSDELELRSYGEFGTTFQIRPALHGQTGSTFAMLPGTLSVDSSARTAIANVTKTVTGNPRRRNYTTYSFSREFRPYTDPPANTGAGVNQQFTLTYTTPASFTPTNFTTDYKTNPVVVSTPAFVWPTMAEPTNTAPANPTAWPRIPIVVPITVDTNTQTAGIIAAPPASYPTPATQLPSIPNMNAMYTLASNATNIATAMEAIAGFNHDEAAAFVANYLTGMWSGMQLDPSFSSANPAYYLPGGPSYVDSTGIAFRTGVLVGSAPTGINGEFGSATDVSSHGGTVNHFADQIMLGYSAQPFIYQILGQSIADSSNRATITDMAIVLYNPYSINLSMRGYKLQDTAAGGLNLDLTQDDNHISLYVPAGGFLIITTDGSFATANGLTALVQGTKPANTMIAVYNSSLGGNPGLNMGGGVLRLRRTYVDRGRNPQLATVDRSAYPGQAAQFFALQDTGGSAYIGLVARAKPTVASSLSLPSNPPSFSFPTAPGSVNPLPLDLSIFPAGSVTTPSQVKNIAYFNRIMRMCNVIDPATGDPPTAASPAGLLTERFGNLGPDTPNVAPAGSTGETLPNESALYFNFWPSPLLYKKTTEYPLPINSATTPNNNGQATKASPGGPYSATGPIDPTCDLRSVTLLDCLATIDRFSDFNIDIGGGNRDINKLRIAGRINVNTASGDVLRAIPNMTDQMVANILGYRNRQSNASPNVLNSYPPLTGTVCSQDYSDQTKYPGVGIRSLAELLVPLGVGGSGNTIDQRDQLWADIYNLCTVRSDTFVVYGYIEAVRENPAYTGAFNNSTVWYNNTLNTDFADNPNDPAIANITNVPLLRIARRRWIAIVDRSYGNSLNSITPRIVAIKDLPQ